MAMSNETLRYQILFIIFAQTWKTLGIKIQEQKIALGQRFSNCISRHIPLENIDIFLISFTTFC